MKRIYAIHTAVMLALLGAAASVLYAQAPPIGQGGAAPGPAIVQRGPHLLIGGGPAPTLLNGGGFGSCGTTNAQLIGSDVAGIVRLGDNYDPMMFCTIKFGSPWPAGTMCLLQPQVNAPPAPTITNEGSDNQYLYLQSSMAGVNINYFCIGRAP